MKLWWAEAIDVGSCNECRRWMSHEGVIPHDVLRIRFARQEIRLCRVCALTLALTLQEELKHQTTASDGRTVRADAISAPGE